MRQLCIILALGVFLTGVGQPALANCVTVERITTLHTLQTRLSRGSDAALFASDIRQIRTLSTRVSNAMALEAVGSNRFAGKGRSFLTFLQNTRDLLRVVSLDDPQSVRRHFNADVRRNLQTVGTYLTDLRCRADEMAAGEDEGAPELSTFTSDAEDMAEVANTLNEIADEVFQWRTIVIVVTFGIAAHSGIRLFKSWRRMRLRRSKRHNVNYDTQYRVGGQAVAGPLLDINCYGTKLKHRKNKPVPKGETIEVLIHDEWQKGTVAWNNHHYTGVAFNTRITLDDVAIIRSEGEK